MVVDLRGLDHVVVIEHQHDVGSHNAQLIDQRGHDRLDRGGLGLLQQGDGGACVWQGPVDRCGYRSPEEARLIVGLVQ